LEKGHGIKVDAQDNVWLSDANGGIVLKLSPEGKLLQTIRMRGKRGDWDEAKGQRLLWQPLDVAFAPNGDIYIAQGHANESPNDAGWRPTIASARRGSSTGPQAANSQGQWYGNQIGPGKFSMAHGIACGPAQWRCLDRRP
jgi:hypothetical protein